MEPSNCLKVENIDHLGLIAGIIDEIGLVEQINKLVGEHHQEKVSAGHAVKAMILNGLGFVSGALYMFPKYMTGKACEHLIGTGIKPEHLNDDRLGRVMDKLYVKGLNQIFTNVAISAAKKYKVEMKTSHLDSSSFHMHGKYETELPNVIIEKKVEGEIVESKATQPINITYGYSRDHRPDLKQFILDLICSSDGDVPLFLKTASGNESDRKVFAQIAVDFKEQINLDTLMVADSALYSAANIALMKDMKWLCRVPLTVGYAKQIISDLALGEFVNSEIDGYSFVVKTSNYGDVKQRWLIVESEQRLASDIKQLEKQILKAEKTQTKKLNQLLAEEFTCHKDAMKALSEFSKKLKYHELTNTKIVNQSRKSLSKNNQSPAKNHHLCYCVQANLSPLKSIIESCRRSAGRFVLATNVLDETALSNSEIISEYKAQQSCERGFGFLKDPLFFTDTIFLKSPERIESLAMIMGLCLLVYTLAQRELRASLLLDKSTIKNNNGRLTNRPTLRWVFQCFQSIHLLIVHGNKQISNLTDERLWILKFFPPASRRYYLID